MKKIKRSFALWCYYQLMKRADRHVERRLRSRLLMGKEDPERLEERLGISLAERPTGNLIWFHAASVGESLSLVELIKRISSSQPDYNFLITTGTITSAKLILSRLPSNAVHQYIPVDTPKAVEKFLDRWRPSLAIWTESEFWPNLISFTSARDIPMILINARISEKSYRRWRFFKKSLKNLIEKFNYSLIQDEKTVKYFSKIGISSNNFELTGTLKEGSAALPHSEIEQVEISKQILNNESVTGSSDVDRLYQNTFTQSYDTNITIESGSATLISDLITIVADTIYDPITKPQEKIEFVSNYPIPMGDSLSPVVAGKLVLEQKFALVVSGSEDLKIVLSILESANE